MNVGQLKTLLTNIMDGDATGFVGFPQNIDEAAQNWANAFQEYYMSMSIPVPGSGNPMLMSGIQTFKNTLKGAMQGRQFHIILEQAITALHMQIIAGVQTFSIYVTIPPPMPLKLQHLFTGNNKTPSGTIAAGIAAQVDPWAKSTISNQVIPPPTVVPFPWTLNT